MNLRVPFLPLVVVLFIFVGTAQICQAQKLVALDSTSAVDGNPETDSGAVLVGEPGAFPADPKSTSQQVPQDPNRLRVVIYPILGWAPILGANVRVPDTPTTPGGGSGSTNSSINGAALFGATVEKGNWYGSADFMWAGMSTSRSNPLLNVNVDGFFSGGYVGYRVYRDFFLTGGFRHMGLDYGVTLGNFPEFKRSPGVWDPLVGILWKKHFNEKWTVTANVQGGGFGVGSNVDVSAVASADWQFAKHFGLTFGYGIIHFNIDDTKLNKTFTVNQTLNGPQFGFGIYF